MSRRFKRADYTAALEVTVRLGDCLPPEHLARFVVDAIAQMDLSGIYARYGNRGGEAYAPEILVGLLFYGYATGVFSTRKIERATFESIPFRYIAGDRHPDHDTIANFRKTFLPELKELFVHLLVLAHLAEVVVLEAISADGTKVHADASKSKAVSYKRLGEIEAQLRAEVEELFALSEQAEQEALPEGLVAGDEIARREAYLARLVEAKAVLEARAAERLAQEQTAYEAKLAQRAEKERTTGRRPGGRPPRPPTPGPRDTDQYNFTDPDARIIAHHEESHRRRVRAGLQCATRGGPRQPAHRRHGALQPSQRHAGSRVHFGHHPAGGRHTRGSGPGHRRLQCGDVGGVCPSRHRALHRPWA